MDPDRPIVRWSLVVLWLFVGLMLYEPAIALFGWPLLLLAFAGGVLWTVQDFLALRHQTECIREGRAAIRTELVVLAAIAALCVATATVPSLQIRERTFALSSGFAPSLMAVLLVAVLRGLVRPTPRRITIVSLVAVGVVSILATIHILGVTDFGFQGLRVISRFGVTGYALCTLAIGAIGIHLGVVARRHGYGADIPAEFPRATVESPLP